MKRKNNDSITLIVSTILFELFIYINSTCLHNDYLNIIPILFFVGIVIANLKTQNTGNKKLYIIYFLGLTIRTIYILKTSIYERQMDVLDIHGNGHLAYIYTIFTTHHLPLTNEWQFYHPPFWHFLGALWLYINQLLNIGLSSSLEGLQILNTFFSVFIILIVDKIGLKLKLKNHERYLIDLIIAVHPTLIRFSGSINNDCLLLFMESLTILLLINYEEKDSWKNIIYLAISTGLTVMTKANGCIIAIPILYVFISKLVYLIKNNKSKIKNYIFEIITFAFISLPIGLWFQLRNIIKFSSTSIPRPADWLYTGNHSLLERFILLDFNSLFKYADMSKDYNFPTFIIKSSLFGEFVYPNVNIIKNILIVLNIILIIISLILIIRYLFNKHKNIYINILLITWLSFIIAMYIFNYKYPYACSMDFRYITICLIPAIFVIGYEKETHSNDIINKIISIIYYLFTIVSAIFIFAF